MKKRIFAALIALCLVAGGAWAQEDLKGVITLYTSQPEKDAAQLIDGFHAKHPNVEVQVFRSGTEEVISKVLAEAEAKSLLVDVLLVADDVTFEALKDRGLLLSYESPELRGIPEQYVDAKDHMYAGTKVITTGIIRNTQKSAAAVSSFADLTKEAVKDQLIMPSPLYSGAAAYNLGVLTRNPDLGWAFYEGLQANGAMVDKGNGAVRTAVVAGNKAYGILVDYMAARAKADGAPVEFVYPAEGSPAITEPIGIMKDSKNQELAKAFVDYVLSEDGQRLAASIGYTPVKQGVGAPEGLRSIEEIVLMGADMEALKTSRESDKARFAAIFQ